MSPFSRPGLDQQDWCISDTDEGEMTLDAKQPPGGERLFQTRLLRECESRRLVRASV